MPQTNWSWEICRWWKLDVRFYTFGQYRISKGSAATLWSLAFLDAQEVAYTQALSELKGGRKQSHWIWYIFPQQKGLGHSYNSKYYGLDGEGEARAYVEHEILGDRLRECCKALLLHKDKDIKYIMGSGIDVLKLKTSMRLFNKVSPNDVFEEVLDVFF